MFRSLEQVIVPPPGRIQQLVVVPLSLVQKRQRKDRGG
jgi:hypothetical protein